MAEPGEFTRRAFLNGKLDLAQAEAVAELISSTSKRGRQAATDQLRGVLSQRLRTMRDAAVSLAAKTGDTSTSTQRYIQALRAQVIEAERAERSASAQVTTYTRLQSEIDQVAAGNDRLAASYRAIYAEEARAANARSANLRAIESRAAPGRRSSSGQLCLGIRGCSSAPRSPQIRVAFIGRDSAPPSPSEPIPPGQAANWRETGSARRPPLWRHPASTIGLRRSRAIRWDRA